MLRLMTAAYRAERAELLGPRRWPQMQSAQSEDVGSVWPEHADRVGELSQPSAVRIEITLSIASIHPPRVASRCIRQSERDASLCIVSRCVRVLCVSSSDPRTTCVRACVRVCVSVCRGGGWRDLDRVAVAGADRANIAQPRPRVPRRPQQPAEHRLPRQPRPRGR